MLDIRRQVVRVLALLDRMIGARARRRHCCLRDGVTVTIRGGMFKAMTLAWRLGAIMEVIHTEMLTFYSFCTLLAVSLNLP